MFEEFRPFAHFFPDYLMEQNIVYSFRKLIRCRSSIEICLYFEVYFIGAAHHSFFFQAAMMGKEPDRIYVNDSQGPYFLQT